MPASLAVRLLPIVTLLLLLASQPQVGAAQPTPALDRGWTPSSMLAATPGMSFRPVMVVAGGPGLVVLVTEEGTTSPFAPHFVLCSSSDGVSWHSVALDPSVFPENAGIQGIAAGPRGMVITGSLQPADTPTAPADPVVWSSPDGEHWRRSAYPAPPDGGALFIFSVAATGAGFVAVGTAVHEQNGVRSPVVLTSTDGTTWQLVPGMQSTFAAVSPNSVVAGGPGFVLIGSANEPPYQPVSYTSRDGVTWSGPDSVAEIPARDGYHLGTYHAFAAPGLLAVVGAVSGSSALGPIWRIWTSTDGQQWQQSDWSGGVFPILSVTDVDGMLVAVQLGATPTDLGASPMPNPTDLWASSDGLHWSQAADDRSFKSTRLQIASVQSIVSFGSALVAIGTVSPLTLTCPGPAVGSPVLTAWRWMPESSQAAPPPPNSPLDPRSFSLRRSDLPIGAVGGGQYTPLCGGMSLQRFSSALGTHSAYDSTFTFSIPIAGFSSNTFGEEDVDSITIVAASSTAAHAAMLHAAAYFSSNSFYTGKVKEQQGTARIGAQARLFAIHVLTQCEGCPSLPTPARAVIWRQGRAISIVVVYGRVYPFLPSRQVRADALRFAAAQDAHLRQASGAHAAHS